MNKKDKDDFKLVTPQIIKMEEREKEISKQIDEIKKKLKDIKIPRAVG